MSINFTMLAVSRLIIHEIPRRLSQDSGVKPTLSEVESELDSDIKGMLRDRLINASQTSTKGFDIERNPTATSPVPNLIQAFLTTPKDQSFVEMSRTMANHLFESQPPISPAGLLTVMECSIGHDTALALLKIEKEEGARLFKPKGGKVTFNLQHFRDLVLTPKTKLFKLAILVQDQNTFQGRAYDNQRSYSSYKAVADFFLLRFLGCRLVESASVSTKKFYENTSIFLSDNFKNDPERYSKVYNHLVSTLTSEKKTFSVKAFAEDFIPSHLRDKYVEFQKKAGMSLGTFDIDTGFVEKRLRTTQYNFKSGTSLNVPNAEVRKRINIKQQPNGDVKVEFTDRLVDVKG